jgi:Plavaka transposase
MFHAQWKILLSDDDLQTSMKHGIVISCNDGIERRFFPRFFTYTADYPEK